MDYFEQSEENYAAAENDAVAKIILAALHAQDSATYHGSAGNMGKRALDAAAAVREAVREEHYR